MQQVMGRSKRNACVSSSVLNLAYTQVWFGFDVNLIFSSFKSDLIWEPKLRGSGDETKAFSKLTMPFNERSSASASWMLWFAREEWYRLKLPASPGHGHLEAPETL